MSYAEIKQFYGNRLPFTFKRYSDIVTVEEGESKEGKFFKVTTHQRNGRTRINYIYENGTVTQSFI